MSYKKIIGDIEQMPPMFSAIKKGGVAYMSWRRRGEEVELKPRTYIFNHLRSPRLIYPLYILKVVCSTVHT